MSDNSNSTIRLAVSPAEAAQMAGIGRTKLYALMATNEIASMKLGSRRLIRVSEIEAFLDRLLAAGTACETAIR